MPYQMKNGRYKAAKMIDGVRRTAVFATLKDAKKWESEQSAEAWKAKILTALSAATDYLDDVKARMDRKTYNEKKLAFKLLFQNIPPAIPLVDLTPRMAGDFLLKQHKARGGNAANGDRKNLLAWWNWCIKRRGVEKVNPFALVDKLPELRRPRIIPDRQDLQTLIDGEHGFERVLLIALFHTAARADEMFRLTWGDVDLSGRRVRLWTRKRKGGMESDWLPMTRELAVELSRHKPEDAKASDLVFLKDGQPLHHDLDIMDKLCQKHDVPRFGFHGIRHLAASLMDVAGKPLSTIQAMLRHKNASTTSRYLHELRGVKVELDSVFSNETGPRSANPRPEHDLHPLLHSVDRQTQIVTSNTLQ